MKSLGRRQRHCCGLRQVSIGALYHGLLLLLWYHSYYAATTSADASTTSLPPPASWNKARSLRKPTQLLGHLSRSKDNNKQHGYVRDTNATLCIRQPSSECLVVQVKDGHKLIITKGGGVQFVNATTISTTNNARDVGGVFAAHALWGVYAMPAGGQLWIFVTASRPALADQQCYWSSIRKVTQLRAFYINSDIAVSKAQQQETYRQTQLLRHALKAHDWYYCEDNANEGIRRPLLRMPDMTHNMQTLLQHHTSKHDKLLPDERFFWNQAALAPLLEQTAAASSRRRDRNTAVTSAVSLLLQHAPVMSSCFVGCAHTNIRDGATHPNATTPSYTQILISRRAQHRAGTRFTKRGADAHGRVANFVETEQIILIDDPPHDIARDSNSHRTLCSHVQTRGSIPLRWSSPTDITTYRPRVRIGTDPVAQARAVRAHLLDQCGHYYGSPPATGTTKAKAADNSSGLVLVNLIDKKSDQGRLGKTFDAVLSAVLDISTDACLASQNVRHVWFDFHAELKHGKWDRLTTLLSQVEPDLHGHGYCAASHNGTDWSVHKCQAGVVRTNCMDCLDRTNVVQSVFARHELFAMLRDGAGGIVLPTPYKTAFRHYPLALPWPDGETCHRGLWADNADAISRLYAGTPALKGDFTRTGKRTKRGAIDDGVNSLQRYYLNNFMDADRQEGIDLLTGHASFNVVDTGNDNKDVLEKSTSSVGSNDLTISRAIRAMLLGGSALSYVDDKSGIDLSSANTMASPRHSQLSYLRAGSLGTERRKALDLLWLPGDLQSQVRSLTDSRTARRGGGSSDIMNSMKALDRRSASSKPWWCARPESDDDDLSMTDVGDDTTPPSLRPPQTPWTSLHGAGIVLATIMVPSLHMPVALASIVLCITAVHALSEPDIDES